MQPKNLIFPKVQTSRPLAVATCSCSRRSSIIFCLQNISPHCCGSSSEISFSISLHGLEPHPASRASQLSMCTLACIISPPNGHDLSSHKHVRKTSVLTGVAPTKSSKTPSNSEVRNSDVSPNQCNCQRSISSEGPQLESIFGMKWEFCSSSCFKKHAICCEFMFRTALFFSSPSSFRDSICHAEILFLILVWSTVKNPNLCDSFLCVFVRKSSVVCHLDDRRIRFQNIWKHHMKWWQSRNSLQWWLAVLQFNLHLASDTTCNESE